MTSRKHVPTLFRYMATQISALRRNGKLRTAETYITTLNSFRRFRQGQDISLAQLTSEQMEAYQAW